MKRLWVVALVVILGGLFLYLYMARVHADEADPLADIATWAPDAAALHSAVDSVPKGATAEADAKARHEEFAKLMTGRFRNHEPSMAIRVKFDNDALIDLMCPARMEPWNMDRLATTVWREAKSDLGRSYNVDIFITYIGTAPIKVGELRGVSDNPDKIMIRYHMPGNNQPLVSQYTNPRNAGSHVSR